MTEKFDRVYRLEIGEPGKIGKRFSQLQMSFTVEKSTAKNGNKATVSILNPNPETKGVVTAARDLRVRLYAGYRGRDGRGTPQLIYEGKVGKRGALIERVPPDTTITLECVDKIPPGALSARSSFNWNFEAGTTNRQVLDQIIKEAGLGVGFLSTIPLQTYKSGVVFLGSVEEALDKIVDPAGLEWSLQDWRLQILERGSVTTVTAPVISARTGMINAPTRTDKGINVKMFLEPSLAPGMPVKVIADAVDGFFRCRNVTHSGNLREGEWMTEIEAEEIET